MTPKNLADEFINKNREKNGLRAVFASAFSHDAIANEAPGAGHMFTDGHHFICGYNGSLVGARRSTSDVYWVDYSQGASSSGSLEKEVVRALRMISSREGLFSVPYTGTIFSNMLIRLCHIAEVPHVLTNLQVKNVWEPEPPNSLGDSVETIELNESEFTRLFGELAVETFCPLPLNLFFLAFGALSSYPHIYETVGLELTNFNYDFISDQPVGPRNWQVVDRERFAPSWSYLLKKNRRGIPLFFHYTPELIRAFLNRPEIHDLLTTDGKNSSEISKAIFLKLCESENRLRGPAIWPNTCLQKWLQTKAVNLLDPQASYDQWATPMEVMAQKFNLDTLAEDIAILEASYGSLF